MRTPLLDPILVAILCFLSSCSSSSHADLDNDPPNANHIFSALHSSLRHLPSALQHNGMTIFPALIPAGTLLYRGTRGNRTIKAAGWAALEPEHALWHAAGKNGRRRATTGHVAPLPSYGGAGPQAVLARPPHPDPQAMGSPTEEPQSDRPRGWLWTHAPTRDLRLLYLDGLAAAKSTLGTLDLQDVLLLDYPGPETSGYDVPDERRARDLCSVARDRWGGRIDGFIRARLGVEVLLCEFNDVTRVKGVTHGVSAVYDTVSWWQFWRAAGGARYADGRRVRVSTGAFFTMFDEEVGLFGPGERHPRLVGVEKERLKGHRERLDEFVNGLDWDSARGYDWQALTDGVVARYGDVVRLAAAAAKNEVESESLRRIVEPVLRPFVAGDGPPDLKDESAKCALHSLQGAPVQDVAYAPVATVVRRLCSDLVALRHEHKVPEAKTRIDGLVDYLAWTAWRECPRGCPMDQICFVPVTPWGSMDDAEQASCVNAMGLRNRSGYWTQGSHKAK